MNPEAFNKLEIKTSQLNDANVALSYIEAGHPEKVSDHFDEFEPLPLEVVKRLIHARDGMSIIFNLNLFEHLDITDIVNELKEVHYDQVFIDYILGNGFLNQEAVDLLIATPEAYVLARHIDKFTNVDQFELACALINHEKARLLRTYSQNFNQIPQRIMQDLLVSTGEMEELRDVRNIKKPTFEVRKEMETARTTLCPAYEATIEELLQIYNDQEMLEMVRAPWSARPPQVNSPDQAKKFRYNALNNWVNSKAFAFLIRDKEKNIPIGQISFSVEETGEANFGSLLIKEYRHSGYMTEVRNFLVNQIKTTIPQVNKLTAETNANNSAARRSLEKVGFILKKMEEVPDVVTLRPRSIVYYELDLKTQESGTNSFPPGSQNSLI